MGADVDERADILIAQPQVQRQVPADFPVVIQIVTVPPGTAGLDAFSYDARRREREPEKKIPEGMAREVAPECEAATPQPGDGSRGVLLVARQRKSRFERVVAAYPGQAAGVRELVGDVLLIIEVPVAEARERDVAESDCWRALELRPSERVIDPKLGVDAILVCVRAALCVQRARE